MPAISNAGFTQTYDTSQFGNAYMFTSRRVDSLDTDDLQLQYNRNRYLDYHTGRWLTHDPLGIVPNGYVGNTAFIPTAQYGESRNIYEYVQSNPVLLVDPRGLRNYTIDQGPPFLLLDPPPHGYISSLDPANDGWGSERPTREDFDLLEKMLGVADNHAKGRPNASRLLRHFLDNSGQDAGIELSPGSHSLMANVYSARDALVKEVNEAMGFAETNVASNSCSHLEVFSIGACEMVRTLYDTPYFIRSQAWSTSEVGITESLDWFAAIHQYQYMGRGRVTPMPNCQYRMNFQYLVYDRYNWDVRANFYPYATGEELHHLHLAGLAQEFNVHGALDFTITWRKNNRLQGSEIVNIGKNGIVYIPPKLIRPGQHIRLVW